MGLAVLCAAALPAQVTFLGAQRTVPATGLSGPNGSAVDSSGNLYIADTGSNRVVKIAPSGTQTVVSVAPLSLSFPVAVALDGAGNLYVADNGNERVVKVPAGGGTATVFAPVFTPDGLAVDASGNVFVTDNEDGWIVKIASNGASSAFETGFTDPVDVAVDAAGNVYLADGTLTHIVKFPADGGDGTNVGSSLPNISGVAVDRSGNVYVGESSDSAVIVKITPVGAQTTLATSGLGAATYFAVDSNYDLFIPDNVHSHVIEFSTISVPLGYANVCLGGAPAPCSQTATLQFAVNENFVSSVGVFTGGVTGLDFSQSGGTCSGETSPCTVQVTFQPTQPGMRSGDVTIFDECEVLNVSVPVYGTGNGADAAFSPALTSPPFGTDGFGGPVAVAVAAGGVFNGGPIFIADDTACVIWIAGEGENFNVYAGNFTCGYAGDGGTATGSTELYNPHDVALDGTGNLYIADTGNNLIRKVDRTGRITTVAGNFERGAGFFGDGGAATNAALNLPESIAVDIAGNLYIADTLNNRIRKVDLAGTITTVAGSNSGGYSGDGGAATSAQLNHPLGVTTDTAGNLFIADTFNNAVRKVDLTGTITTVAGDFALDGGYSGDGGPATSAQLYLPEHVSVDAAGEVFISDDGNGVIRRVNGAGTISTYAVPTDYPEELVVDPTGNLAVIDPEDLALTLIARTIPPGLAFGSQNTNTSSAAQDVIVTDIGNQALNFSMLVPPTGFNLSGPDNSCSTESALNAGLDCILGIVFDPPPGGNYDVLVTLTDNSFVAPAAGSQSVAVTGTGVAPLTPTTTTLTASPNPAVIGQTVTLTATVTPTPTGGTLGTVEFCLGTIGPSVVGHTQRTQLRSLGQWKTRAGAPPETPVCSGSTLLGSASVVAAGTATSSTTTLALGANVIRAIYLGNGILANSISAPVTETINPRASTTTTLAASPNPALSGQTVTLTATVTPTPTGETPGSVYFCLGQAELSVMRSAPQSHLRSAGPGKTRVAVAPEESVCEGGTLLGTVGVIAGGTATFTTTSLAVGANVITAIYEGNGTLADSISAPVTETINSSASTTTTLTVSPKPVTVDQSVTLTGTVSPVPTGTPLGTITFCDAGAENAIARRAGGGKSTAKLPRGFSARPEGGASTCGVDTLLQTAAISTQGVATYATTTLTVGDHNIYAIYSGNSAFAGSTSDTQDETVNAAYTVTAPQTPFAVSEGGSVQITVTVPPLGGSYTNVVTLVASGLPPRATATFNPPTVTPGADGQETIMTIQLATSGAAQQPGAAPSGPSSLARRMWFSVGIGSLFLLVIIIPMMGSMMGAMWRRRPLPRLARVVLSAAIISAGALVMAGCNGGFAGLSTPAGQYTITITGTSGSLHPSTTVTVVVQ
ncbi:MAG: Ig-like domain repeat protein [Candidatus Acidiferrales bacterium]